MDSAHHLLNYSANITTSTTDDAPIESNNAVHTSSLESHISPSVTAAEYHYPLTEYTLLQHASDLNREEQYAASADPTLESASSSTTQYAYTNSAMDSTIAKAKQCLSPIPPQLLADRRQTRRGSGDIPRQTIIKAMASRPISSGTTTASVGLNNSWSSMAQALSEAHSQPHSRSSPPSPSIAAQVASLPQPLTITPPSMATSIPAAMLRSPCFFHQRFEGLVDIQKVLEEIKDAQEADEEYSHCRLMQTATGVREVSKQLQRKPLKRAVRSVMIVTRARDNSLVHLTRELAEWLLTTPRYGQDIGVNVYIDAKLKHSKRFDAPSLQAKDPRFKSMLRYWTPDLCWSHPEKFDLVLTLGGDGTVLFTSWLFQRVVPPILSFALGSLGFLTNFSFDNYKAHLTSIMNDAGMRVNLRMRFTCTVWRKDRTPNADKNAVEEGEQFEVLNELVIDRGPSAYVSNLELYGDDELLTVVQADGCIFSTPTGSTAYSLSAGGSLIHPSIPAILLTPICPHTLSFRPMVLSDTLSLRIAVPPRSRSSAYCSFDGKGRIELKQGDYVTLEASQYPFPTVMTGTNEWVESVQRALRWNVRGAEQRGWAQTVDGEEGEEQEQEEWDIDIGDSNGVYSGTDSGIDVSEVGDGEAMATGTGTSSTKHGTQSPSRKGTMSLLNM
ncbi:NAD(+) kinase [Knufia obscura]|uniref:NAD(+) kinase n=1 Tax=Knufia obscura TaxID=1635080 RepID=A0ABR0RNE3_9EURO|nr:NAD(+) kinase [Knufia obscura]